MNDILVLKNGKVEITPEGMCIPEFKDFRRYDSSTNKSFFDFAMNYIYFVYDIYGEERSYLHNLPVYQRKLRAVADHTGPHKDIDIFDKNKHVKACIDQFLSLTWTSNERLLDAMRDDIERFIAHVQSIPHEFKEKVLVEIHNPESEDPDNMIKIPVEVKVPYIEGRINALKKASDLKEMYDKIFVNVQKDGKKKNSNKKYMFEDSNFTKKIPTNNIAVSEE